MYQQIRKSVQNIESNMPKNSDISPIAAIFSSKIYSKLKFGKDARGGIQRSRNQANMLESFSKIQFKNQSKLIQNLNRLAAVNS